MGYVVNWTFANDAPGGREAVSTAKEAYRLMRHLYRRGALYVDMCTADCPTCPLLYVESDLEQVEPVNAIAWQFALELVAEVGRTGLREINRRNADLPAGLCASHDLCDANMPMARAFELVMGYELDPASESDVAILNLAWEAAKRAGFWLDMLAAPLEPVQPGTGFRAPRLNGLKNRAERQARADLETLGGVAAWHGHTGPRAVNGCRIIAFWPRRAGGLRIVADRGTESPHRYVVASWHPNNPDSWSWGYYCETAIEARETLESFGLTGARVKAGEPV